MTGPLVIWRRLCVLGLKGGMKKGLENICHEGTVWSLLTIITNLAGVTNEN
jgi:hypothetical protein